MDKILQLNCSMKIGDRLKVEGNVPANGKRFQIDLGNDERNLGLHIGVRFDEGVVVFNALTDGTWGKEERISPVPLKMNEEVKIVVTLLGDKFEVDFPGKKGVPFHKRLHMDEITYACAYGDFKVTSFQIESK